MWKLITNLPVKTLRQAIEKLRIGMPCAGRSRCSTRYSNQAARLRNPNSAVRERLANLISIFCIIGWRVFRSRKAMLHRAQPDLAPRPSPLDTTEVYLLDEFSQNQAGEIS